MDALRHLERLVSINSFTFNREGINRVGDYCCELFAPLGFSAERVPYGTRAVSPR